MINKEIEININENQASIITYILDNSKEIDENRVRPMVIICPGGGYRFLSDREAEPIAIQMNAMGFHACILRYSVYPAAFPTALMQLAYTVAYIREHAKEWNVCTNKIIVAGFSAGGHLAASLGTLWQEGFLEEMLPISKDKYRPNGMILSYPVINSGDFAHRDSFEALLQDKYLKLREEVSLENKVSKFTPPAFIWHTYADQVVPVENSLLFAMAMRKNNIPVELHIYPRGDHGLALANEETEHKMFHTIYPECQNWISMAGSWLRNL